MLRYLSLLNIALHMLSVLGDDDFFSFLNSNVEKKLHTCSVGKDLPRELFRKSVYTTTIKDDDDLELGMFQQFEASSLARTNNYKPTIDFYWQVQTKLSRRDFIQGTPGYTLAYHISGQPCPFNKNTHFNPETLEVSCPQQINFSTLRLPWKTRFATYTIKTHLAGNQEPLSGVLSSDASLGNRRWDWTITKTLNSETSWKEVDFNLTLSLLDPVSVAKRMNATQPQLVTPTTLPFEPSKDDMNDVQFEFENLDQKRRLPTVKANCTVLAKYSSYFERFCSPAYRPINVSMVTSKSPFLPLTVLAMLEYFYKGEIVTYAKVDWSELQRAAIYYLSDWLELYVLTEYLGAVNGANQLGRAVSSLSLTSSNMSLLDKYFSQVDDVLRRKWHDSLKQCLARTQFSMAEFFEATLPLLSVLITYLTIAIFAVLFK